MSIVRSVDATLRNFSMNIDGKPLLLDHVKQLNLYLAVGSIGEPGDLTITMDMFKMISEESQRFSPVGKTIDFHIEDHKSGIREYRGVIVSFRKIHNVKQDLVVMSFDKEEYCKLRSAVWWKTFKEKTIVEIFEEFLTEHGLSLNQFPQDHQKNRGTFFEYFAMPINTPTLNYLLSELAKDNFLVFSNPETGGVTVASWYDINRLDILNQNNPDYVVDGVLAKFDETKDQWKQTTFINGKQIDTRAPWKIMEWQNSQAPNLHQDSKHACWYYSSIKKPLEFKIDESELLDNDINLQTVEEYSGQDLIDSRIQPYPAIEALQSNDNTPKVDTSGYDGITNAAIYPRYYYHRMRESYSTNIKWIQSSMMIAGSPKSVVPLSTIMITYFPNALNRNPEEPASRDPWTSGLYLVMSSQLIITGNNILCKYSLAKPYH